MNSDLSSMPVEELAEKVYKASSESAWGEIRELEARAAERDALLEARAEIEQFADMRTMRADVAEARERVRVAEKERNELRHRLVNQKINVEALYRQRRAAEAEAERYRIEADCGLRDYDALELRHGDLFRALEAIRDYHENGTPTLPPWAESIITAALIADNRAALQEGEK